MSWLRGILLMILTVTPLVFSQSYDELKPWEKLGITSREWHEAQVRGFPDDSIKIVVSLGLTVSDWFKKPWERFGFTVEAYLAYRLKGYSDEDLYKMQHPDTIEIVKSDFHADTRTVDKKLKSFLFPGYYQFKEGRRKTAIFQWSVIGVGAIATIGVSVYREDFTPVFIVATVPVMFWSYFTRDK